MVRAGFGEAGLNRTGLWINDKQQGWSLKIGDITYELLYDQYEMNPVPRVTPKRHRTAGVHFTKRF